MPRLTKSLLSTLQFVVVLTLLVSTPQINCTNVRTNVKKDQPKKNEKVSCSALKNWWVNNGLDVNQLSKLSMKNESLQVCGKGPSCCTTAIEEKLVSVTRTEMNKTFDQKLDKLKQSFGTIATKYDSFCVELINKSAIDLDVMFRRTYGSLYEQEFQIFDDLFKDLRSYYRGRNMDLAVVFQNFFRKLMQRMFTLFNAHYTLDDGYLSCVVGQMDGLQPFRDVPQKLSSQVKRAFVAARTYLQGLLAGKDVISATQKIELSQSCIEAYTRMTSCSHCTGLNNVKPCRSLCANVMKGCLVHFHEINQAWTAYIDHMTKVMERLEGPFNLVSIIEPINVKISEAIMNYQENVEDVNPKVFMGCGQLKRGSRSKRAFSHEPSRSDMKFGGNVDKMDWASHFDKIMQEVRDKILTSKDLFVDLVPAACSSLTSKPPKILSNATLVEDNCWNGTAKSKYTAVVVDDGLLNQVHNVEVKVDNSGGDPIINKQNDELRTISTKLKNAYNGLDVVWDDDDTEGSSGREGSGDTDGSGGSGYDDDEDDEDISFDTSTMPHRRYHNHGVAGPVVNIDLTTRRPLHPASKLPYQPYYSSANFVLAGLCYQLIMWLASLVVYTKLAV